jgi:hypothetical protein
MCLVDSQPAWYPPGLWHLPDRRRRALETTPLTSPLAAHLLGVPSTQMSADVTSWADHDSVE